MQRDNIKRPDHKLGRSLGWFWGVMQEMNQMMKVAHGLDANPGSRSREESRDWEPLVTEMPAGGDLMLYFELPGVEREDVDLSLHGQTLVVSGVRKDLPSFEDVTVEDFVSGEGPELGPVEYSPFKRAVELPRPVEQEEVEAGFGAGLLQIRIPEIAERRSQRIHVRSGRYPRQ